MVMAKAPKDRLEFFRNTRYFLSLDGLRAFSVVFVMFNHMHVWIPSGIDAHLGVDTFLVLSGFLITTLMLRERVKTGRISLKGFYIRRVFRILPVYLFTIALYGIAVKTQHNALKTAQYKAALPWVLTFNRELMPAAEGNVLGHAWSLGVEEKFYVLWPLLVLALVPFRGRKAWGLAALAIAVLLLPWPYPERYGGLMIGAVVAIALSVEPRWNFVQRIPPVPDFVLMALVLATYLLHYFTRHYALLFCGSIALLIVSLVSRQGMTRRFLENRVLMFIGRRSYAIYMIHVLVLDSVEKYLGLRTTLNWVSVLGVSLVASLAGASLIHVIIERPSIAFGQRLSRRYAHSNSVTPPPI